MTGAWLSLFAYLGVLGAFAVSLAVLPSKIEPGDARNAFAAGAVLRVPFALGIWLGHGGTT
jgi:hypothetical protein